MMVPSDYLPANKRSLFFGGEATIFLRDSKTHRSHDTQIVRMGYFWYWFRKMLVLIALISFTVAFLIPYLFLNSTDGYILSGGILSLVFCLLALLSYLHILPWRRHPSSLLIQVCGMSAVLSTVAVVMAYPEGGRLSSLNDGSDINIIGDKEYTSRHDHTPGCLSMSFILQLTLFAREMWILTLSLDLLTNITNPFASYKINLRKYHGSIWAASVLGAVLLVSQTGDCQGEFLNNGTCWIKISDVDSTCFWAYFMAWVILFYVNAIAVLAYAFSRISKGLESTYATHYSFVVDTFRIVVFFFLYGVLLASLFLVLYYASGIRSHRDTLNTLEHVFAFCIATRGFFDALIWFFTHGFTEESNGLGINPHHEETTGVTSMQALMKAISSRRLTMRDIFQPKLWLLECVRALPSRWTTRESDDDEELRQNTQAINGHEQGDSDVTTILLSSSQSEQRASPLKRRVTSSGDNKPSDDEEAGTDVSDHQLGKSRPTESTLSRSYPTTVATSTFDFSPQLNLALRAEVLYVVTLGIRESVLKLSERERRLRQVAEEMEKEWAEGAERGFSGKEGDGKTGRSFSLRRGLTSDSAEEDFVRIRLSSNSASDSHRQTDVSNILRDIYTTTTPFAPNYNNNNQTRHSLAGSHTHAPSTSHNTTTVNTQQSQRHTRPQQRSQRYNPNNSLSFNPHASLAFHSVATSSLLFSLMSVTGAYIPGEYGVDAMAYLDDVDKQPQPHISHHTSKPASQGSDNTTSNSQTNTPPRTPSKSNPNNPINTLNNGEERESKTKIPFEQPSASTPSPSPSKHHPSFYLDHLERLSKEPAEVSVELPPPPAEVIFNVSDKYRFRDFRPATFRTLRQLSGMSDEQYLSVISQPAQEKLSEGRSGAFFFVCGEGDVIVKTVEASEAKTLLSILDKYVTHLMRFPESLLVRFFGLHSIRMYGNDFTFVVMKNIFPKAVQLNEKYDIKGSYVARNATLKMPGKLSTCRYCHCQFIEGTSDRCSEVVGGHEAIITLKDNDMISKIRLYPGDAYQIIDTLLNDSDALCDMGLMDYSLLVGVKHGYYDVDWFKTSKHFATSSDGVTESKTNNGSHITTDAGQSEEKHIQAAYPARAVIAPKEYYFGVIDVLQTWSWSKKLEHFIKVYLFGQPADGVSCVDPIQFKLRYQRKIMRIIEHEGFVREVTGSWVGKREIGNPFALVSNKETENS